MNYRVGVTPADSWEETLNSDACLWRQRLGQSGRRGVVAGCVARLSGFRRTYPAPAGRRFSQGPPLRTGAKDMCRLSLREICRFRGAKGNKATVIDMPILSGKVARVHDGPWCFWDSSLVSGTPECCGTGQRVGRFTLPFIVKALWHGNSRSWEFIGTSSPGTYGDPRSAWTFCLERRHD